MSNTPSGENSEFDRIVDDETSRREAVEWAADELTDGRSFEEVAAGLAAAGWPAELAGEILESARQATRGFRGAVTRDEVVREANRNYRKGLGLGWFAGFPSISAAIRLLYSIGSLVSLRKREDRRDPRR
jgi:hypothetical protein